MSSNHQGLRLIFAGTPAFAAHHLQALIHSRHQVIAVYTQPDRPAGRGKQVTQSPTKELALTNNISVYQPSSLKGEPDQQQLAALNADAMVVVAYGLLLPQAILTMPRYGCFNVHGSLLPRWRGAAPIQRAIEAGDKETGVTIMQMDTGLDTGDMLYTSACAIAPGETSASLHDKLMGLGAPALLAALDLLESGELQPVKQNDTDATYADKISKTEALIDWSQPVSLIERRIRAFNPFPIAYTFINDIRVKIHSAQPQTDRKAIASPGEIIALDESGLAVACAEGVLVIQSLQLPGKKPMAIQDIINGYSDLFAKGRRFGGQ